MEAAIDYIGGSQNSFTGQMLRDIDDVVRNRNPRDYGYSRDHWDT